jgi:hypothetical protein
MTMLTNPSTQYPGPPGLTPVAGSDGRDQPGSLYPSVQQLTQSVRVSR